MAVKSYNGVNYNTDNDYAALIKQYSGNKDASGIVADLEKARAAKIQGENMTQYMSPQPNPNLTPPITTNTETSSIAAKPLGNSPKIINNATPIASAGATAAAKVDNSGQDAANEYINKLSSAQSQAQLSALEAAKQKSLNQLDAEQKKIAPEFYNQRNNLSSANQLQARNFQEFLANRRLNRGGAAIGGEMRRETALVSGLGQLNTAEAEAQADIERKRREVELGFTGDVTTANANIEAQKMEALLNQYNQNKSYGLQEAGLTGSLNGVRTLGGQTLDLQSAQDAYNRGIQDAQITGTYKDQRTLQGQSVDSQLATQKLQRQALETQNKYLEPSLQAEIEGKTLQNTGLGIQNQYLEPSLQADIEGKTLQNTGLGIQNQYLEPSLQADIEGKTLQNKTAETNLQYLPKMLEQQYNQGELQNIGLEISNSINKITLENLPERNKLEIAVINQTLQKGNLDIAAQQIQNSYLPDTLKAQLNGIVADTAVKYNNIENNNAQTALGWATLSSNNENKAKDRAIESAKLAASKSAAKDGLTAAQYQNAVEGKVKNGIDYLDNYLTTSTNNDGTSTKKMDKTQAIIYVTSQYLDGEDKNVVDGLASYAGITAKDIETEINYRKMYPSHR